MITYQEENVDTIWNEGQELFILNSEEIKFRDDKFELNRETYDRCEAVGALKIYTVRDDNILIGYCIFFVMELTHHKGFLSATQDVLFIKKEKRGRVIPFIRYTERMLKDYGVKSVNQSVPYHRDWSPVLTRMGYDKLETIYTRKL